MPCILQEVDHLLARNDHAKRSELEPHMKSISVGHSAFGSCGSHLASSILILVLWLLFLVNFTEHFDGFAEAKSKGCNTTQLTCLRLRNCAVGARNLHNGGKLSSARTAHVLHPSDSACCTRGALILVLVLEVQRPSGRVTEQD